jgi:pyruvate kinase
MPIKTKIIATIGPSSNTKPMLKKLIDAGMNVARLNFSHGSYETHGEVINCLRSLSRTMNRPIGILLDLQGPKIRTAKLKDGGPVFLQMNNTVSITTKNIPGTAGLIATTYKNLPQDVNSGDTILLDDGLIELNVLSKTEDTVQCKIISGGFLKENKGINLPGVAVSAPSMTPKDKRDVNFGLKNNVDYFALSFVRTAEDLLHIKKMIKQQGCDTPVIAKIEKPEAVKNIHSILGVADGIMVARGDLGVEMNPEQVPTIQKQLIRAANYANKPVITATQMLESMCGSPIPTRAEASDVANAIFDGTGAVMLSGETASGSYPLEAVAMMTRIAATAETSPFMKYNLQYPKNPVDPVSHAVSQSAVNILHELSAKGILVFSVSGSTAKLISRKRPGMPVYVFTPNMKVYNRLALIWGIIPLYLPNIADVKRLIKASENILVEKGLLKADDLVVIAVGLGFKEGSTNVIKIHRVGHED